MYKIKRYQNTVSLFQDENHEYNFPQTRYQGSKRKLIDWIKLSLTDLKFQTTLDLFGGTGSVSYLFKTMGKTVTFNDNLKFNSIIAKALIENNNTILSIEEALILFKKSPNINYPNKIEKYFKDIYYNEEENRWLDVVITNINLIQDEYKRSIAFYALFQSCLIKRPYNLFHRKNLGIRNKDVLRTFGNKKTWDTHFEKHFLKFIEEANCSIFTNTQVHQVLNLNSNEVLNLNYDLVYMDPPYISTNGTGVNYFDFYHFLEGMLDYSNWEQRIDFNSKHLKIKKEKDGWCDKKLILKEFKATINQFKESTIVISYRDDGIPTVEQIVDMLEQTGKKVEIKYFNYKYVLSNKKVNEVLIIGTNV